MHNPYAYQIHTNKRYGAIDHDVRSQGRTHKENSWNQLQENIRKAEERAKEFRNERVQS